MNSMHAISIANRPEYITRILSDAAGRQFRVTFAVTLVNGELRGRIISAELIAHLGGDAATNSFCLPCAGTHSCTKDSVATFSHVVSPYFSSLDYLLTSQPTRAPSFAR
ncbi:MAG: hypothetical protein KGJ33_02750 [Patescibacteria group bacterium]|nr:hypothetical protein [Patescibacteria group bacterium]